MRVNLPAIGQAYKHPDLALSAQVTKNWYPEINLETSVVVSLQPFPGATLFSSGNGTDRGMTEWNSMVYKVTANTLYKIDSAGVQSSVGAINGVKRCTFPASTEFLVIVTSGFVYKYDGAALTEITDSDLESPDYGAYLNQQWIYQGKGARFAVSDAGQPDQINGLNYAAAESEGDDLVRPYVFNQVLYLFGERNIESWYNSGVGNPPFDRIQGGIVQKGLSAADSVSSNDKFIYFLGSDRVVYRLAGAQATSITTIPIAAAFQAYADVSDAVGFCYKFSGQDFYQIQIGGDAWVFNESAGGWFQVTVDTNEAPHPATSYLYAYGKNLIAVAGDVLELSTAARTFNNRPIVRERISGLISGDLLGARFIGQRLFMSRMEIIIKGVPPLGDAPQIMLSWSDDAGYTWSNERIITCGKLGNYTFKAVAHQLGSFYDRVIKIRLSDDSNYSLHRVSGDIDAGN